jgi:hypothetical protein
MFYSHCDYSTRAAFERRFPQADESASLGQSESVGPA